MENPKIPSQNLKKTSSTGQQQLFKSGSLFQQQFFNDSFSLNASGLDISVNATNNESNISLNGSEDLLKLDDFIFSNQDHDKKVLIVCLGGTISMVQSDEGLVVEKGTLQRLMKQYFHFYDQEYIDKEGIEDWYVTPTSIYGKRTWYQFHEVENPVDSSNMTSEDYIEIATIIEQNYDKYDAFLLIHGTDTMCYTASMLSFLFENLGKTVVLTGSMIPLAFDENDAYNNLICSLLIVGHFRIPEVTIFMNDRLIRGNRAKKMSSEGLDAFDSPMVAPLIQFEESNQGKLVINKNLIHDNSSSKEKFRAHKILCDEITTIQITPTLNLRKVRMLLNDPFTQGFILETYGAGNVPSNKPELLTLLKEAIDNGKIIVNISQCYYSSVSPIYQTGNVLKKIGVIFGLDVTYETCLSKMAYILGKDDLSIEEKRAFMAQSIRGEITTQCSQDKDQLKKRAVQVKEEKEKKLKEQFLRRQEQAFPHQQQRATFQHLDIVDKDDDLMQLLDKLSSSQHYIPLEEQSPMNQAKKDKKIENFKKSQQILNKTSSSPIQKPIDSLEELDNIMEQELNNNNKSQNKNISQEIKV